MKFENIKSSLGESLGVALGTAEGQLYPRLIFFDWHSGDGFELGENIIQVGADRDTHGFGHGANVFFPLSPRVESQEETAGGNGFVGHVTRGLGDKAVGPGEDIVQQELVGVDDVVAVKDAEGSLGIIFLTNLEAVNPGKSREHSLKVCVYSGVGGDMNLTFFDGRSQSREELEDLIFVGAEAACGDRQAQGAVTIAADGGVSIFEHNTRVDRTAGHGDSFFVDFVAEDKA